MHYSDNAHASNVSVKAPLGEARTHRVGIPVSVSTSLRRRVLCGLLFVAGSVVAANAVATERPKAYFSGIAFTSNAADRESAFPHLSRTLDAESSKHILGDIRSLLRDTSGRTDLVFDQLGSTRDSSRSTAVALAIDRETTSIEHIGDAYKTRIEISMQLLFFDFKEKQVLGGFPVVLDYIDVGSEPPTDEEIQSNYDGFALGTLGKHGLASAFADVFADAVPPNPASRRLRVSTVSLAPKAVQYLQEHSPGADQAILRRQIAQVFGTYLAANQKISILPYASNQALGGSMPLRFVEGDAYQLAIPEADYDIALTIAGFKKREYSHNRVAVVNQYGAYVDVSVTEPISGKVYFSQRLKQGSSNTIPITQSSSDDWTAAYDTLTLLFSNFTKALSGGDSKWVDSALPAGTKPRTQLSSLKALVKSCR